MKRAITISRYCFTQTQQSHTSYNVTLQPRARSANYFPMASKDVSRSGRTNAKRKTVDFEKIELFERFFIHMDMHCLVLSLPIHFLNTLYI